MRAGGLRSLSFGVGFGLGPFLVVFARFWRLAFGAVAPQ